MELDVKKSKALKISLLVLAVIILLAIGAAMGSHFGRNRGYGNNGYGCGNFNKFERNGRQNMMPGGRRGQAQGGFRMIAPQVLDTNIQSQVQAQAPVTTSTPSVAPLTK